MCLIIMLFNLYKTDFSNNYINFYIFFIKMSESKLKKYEIERFHKISRQRPCKFEDRCGRFECPFIHLTRGEQKNDLVKFERKIIDLRFTKVCNQLNLCTKPKCTFAHRFDQLSIKSCQIYKHKDPLCKFYHILDNDLTSKQKILFELMKTDIIFLRDVVPVLPFLFKELDFLKDDVEKIIMEFLIIKKA
jgi:hypothetical protein